MEICDVYNQSGKRTGRAVVRGTELSPGEYYFAVHVWIRNELGEYLVQQRAWHLASSPGVWATTVGFVVAGEDSISGAFRETHEELGLQLAPAHLKRWARVITGNLLQDVWLAEVAKQSLDTPTLNEDVADWKWASKQELIQMIERGEFFAYSYFNELPE